MANQESIEDYKSSFMKLWLSKLPYFATSIFMAVLLTSCSELDSTNQVNLKGGNVSVPSSNQVQDPIEESGWANEMLASVNSVRRDNGVAAITLCSTLMKTAQDYADLMLRENYYDHTGPDGSTPSDRALIAGYDWRNPEVPNPSGLIYQGISENIAKGYKSVSMVMDGWINSPGHFRNLIEADVVHAGFGYSKSSTSDSETYWVQNFGFGGTCG